MTTEQTVRTAFPELEAITDDDLRQRVVDVWTRAIEDNDVDLESMAWWPPLETELEGGAVTTVEHVRAVTGLTIAIADAMTEFVGTDIDRDVAIAGALLHDCSKLYELDGDATGELHEWLPHPHYAVHVLAAAGCSEHLQHIAVAHSPASAVEPRTIEARAVELADQLAVEALFWDRNGALQP